MKFSRGLYKTPMSYVPYFLYAIMNNKSLLDIRVAVVGNVYRG